MIQASVRATQPAPRCTAVSPLQKQVFVCQAHHETGNLPVLVRNLLPFLDGQRTLEQACEAAQISVDRGVAIVKKLSRMGMVVLLARRPTRKMKSIPPQAESARSGALTFGELEEQFFASEVEVPDEERWESTRQRMSRLFSQFVGRMRGAVAG